MPKIEVVAPKQDNTFHFHDDGRWWRTKTKPAVHVKETAGGGSVDILEYCSRYEEFDFSPQQRDKWDKDWRYKKEFTSRPKRMGDIYKDRRREQTVW